ncbi:LAXTG-anchored chaplin ChpC [Streptomyces durmitorensis]|uniref:Chaplin n=1 Tax=Streptomyces durmitorensis TaxID=319947 RepID=A0ABY4Q0G6_9ACTN|nr:chaplin [Streptomyces durmitorensis]UQT59582.1 chaplin [Streptomyces durmitorensis]
MRQVTRKGLITVAAATGVLAISGGYAHADSGARGGASDSPGVLSGNSVQLPVHVPVNVCGNSVNVVGVLNPAVGNNCANTSDEGGSGTSKPPGGGSAAEGHSSDSPGVGSGNDVQLPVDVPVNVCGNSVTIGGLGNATTGNECANDSGEVTPPGSEKPPTKPEQPPGGPQDPQTPQQPDQPGNPDQPGKPGTPGEEPDDRAVPNQPGTQTITQPKGSETLAATGSELPVGVVLPVGAGMLLAGTVLYRRARSAA